MIAKTRFMRLPSVCRVARLPSLPRLGNAGPEGRDVAWPQEAAHVEPHGGAGLGETQAGVSPRPGDRGHDTWATARTQAGPVLCVWVCAVSCRCCQTP